MTSSESDVLIVGGGIGGLTLALSLHQAGISCRVFEAAPDIQPLGVGINILPHGMRELCELGLQDALTALAIETRELAFYSRHGQFIYKEPRGRYAGYDWPQLSIHRADLHKVLLDAAVERLGADAIRLDHRCLNAAQDGAGVTLHFDKAEPQRGKVAVGCDGIHSALRWQLYPDQGPPKYSGVNMWRGAVRWPAFLSGDTMVSTGWMTVGKTVIYPVRPGTPETDGKPLINWVAEIERPEAVRQDWTGRGRLSDMMPAFAGLKFDWLDISGMIESTEEILEYPMVDRDPLPRWTFGRITLLGDAAHPMYPRGSNGAGQSIIDARYLTGQIKQLGATEQALQQYEAVRGPATANVVLANRNNPPDTILREVWQRSGGQRFERIEDVISPAELQAISDRYKKVAGFDRESLRTRSSFV
ncbi:flavin-dependent oxidoreductase [Reyranella soli]|uniref:Flavin-dependent oxidoreductase n=1 Tax=Reyranella soli TaxID=1230389 RepID=A0A512NFW6_9HYPH|nr:flavin-dependent oxidoreductase [Reyranella soli]GEP57837.1 flavin-dependent oxidoreductase [Reyranella soli]